MLTLVMVLTVLFGSSYVLAWNYKFPIPWIALVVVAVIASLLIVRRPQRP
jgi:hypothetical protein